DRNGHKVGNFPKSFRTPATNGIAVFDYSNSRNYRIFIACEDKHTYLYDIKGNLIKGWEATKNEHQVQTSIQHFVNGNKDYIVYNDGYRNYILNRRGNVRVLPKKNFEKAPNSELCVANASRKQKGMLIATDMSGTIYFTHLNGEVQTKKVGDFSKNHYFTSYDLNCDGTNDFVFVDKGKLFVFDHSGKEIFTHEFDTEKIGTPNFYAFSKNDKKLGICAENKIYLFNANGSIYDGFPLEGYSDFTIGFTTKKAQNFNLFVAGNSDLLFNYSVE
nr:hypothetical protein [Flavobacteriaceae bacterium]